MGLGRFLKGLAAPAVGIGTGLLTGNPALGLSAAGAVSGALKQGEANDLTAEQLDIVRRDIADRQPLRDAFSNRALGPLPAPPNLSAAFGATRSNPFSPDEPVSLAGLLPPDPGFVPDRRAVRRPS